MAQKTMTASENTITDGQIDNIVDKFRAALHKHRSEIASEVAQQIVGVENLGMECYVPVRARVEMLADMITRSVETIGSRAPHEVLASTGRKLYVTDAVVKEMPRSDGAQEVVFFKPKPEEYDHDGWMSDEALDRAYEKRGLRPADPYSLCAVNEADSAFADDHPNCTHWKDKQGKWCYAAFSRWHGVRYVNVRRLDRDWDDDWWFAGLRK